MDSLTPDQSRLGVLVSQSFLVLRGAVDDDDKTALSDLQSAIDDLLDQASEGVTNEASPCLRGRHTLSIDTCGARRLAETIAEPVLQSLIRDRPITRSPYGGIFLADPALPAANAFHWHCDGHFDGMHDVGINLWIPLRACGGDAPGIALVRADENQLRSATLGALPQSTAPLASDHTTVFWPGVTDDNIVALFGPLETPELAVGDLVVFTNAAIHRTHFPAHSSVRRGALIIRYTLPGCALLRHAMTSPTRPKGTLALPQV